MPFKSEAQAKLMRAVAHSPAFAKKVGVPQSVGKKFVREDKEKPMRKRYAEGGGVREGENVNIDDATRARAMAWVKAQQEKGEEKPTPKAEKPTPKAEKPKAKPAPAVTDDDLSAYEKRKTYQRAQEFASSPAGKAEYERRIKGQALERDTTVEENLLGGAALRPLSRLAKSLAGGKAATTAPKAGGAIAKRYDEITPIPNRPTRAPTEAIGRTKPAATPSMSNAPAAPRLPGPRAIEAPAKPAQQSRLTKSDTPERGAEQATREKAIEAIRRGRKTPAKPAKAPSKKPAVKNTRKFNDDESGIEFARGGSVRGWGMARKPRK